MKNNPTITVTAKMIPAAQAATNMVVVHRVLKKRSGASWNNNIEPWLTLLRREMDRTNSNDAFAAMQSLMAEHARGGHPHWQQAWIMAAYVELDQRLHQ